MFLLICFCEVYPVGLPWWCHFCSHFFPRVALLFNSLFIEHLEGSWCLYCCKCIAKPSSNTAVSQETPREVERTREKWTYLRKHCKKEWDILDLLGWNIWLHHRQQMRTNLWLFCKPVGFHCNWRWMSQCVRRWEILETPTEYQKHCKETELIRFLVLLSNQRSCFG